MDNIGPSQDQIDPSWIAHWGEKIGSIDMAEKISQNERLSARAMSRVAASIGIDADAKLDESEANAISFFVDNADHLETLCGLVLNGAVLRSAVSKGEYEQLLSFFSAEDLKKAVSLRQLHPAQADMGIDMEKLPRLISSSGKACVMKWKTGLSPQGALRLRLMDNASQAIEIPAQSIDLNLAMQIVTAVTGPEQPTTAVVAA